MQGHGLGGHEGGGIDQLCGGVELALGVDDLGAALALGLGLLGHGAQHVLRHVHLLDLDRDDLEAEGRGVAVDDDLDTLVEAVAMGEQFVEIDFAEDGAQRGLRELRGLVDVVGDLDDRLDGIDHAHDDDGVDLQCDVVACDDVLRGDLHRLLAQADADNLVDGAEDQDDAGAGGVVTDAAQAEDDGAFVLLEDLDGVEDVKQDDGNGNEVGHGIGHRADSFPAGRSLAAAVIVNGARGGRGELLARRGLGLAYACKNADRPFRLRPHSGVSTPACKLAGGPVRYGMTNKRQRRRFWLRQNDEQKTEADSSASLRNDKAKGQKANTEILAAPE